MHAIARGSLFVTGLLAACAAPAARPAVAEGEGDTAFAALQVCGGVAMGVDQYTSAHLFEPLPDGGRIVLRRDAADSAGVATIRAHMGLIARRFGEGDFTIPELVHAEAVPGTAVMAAQRDRIAYTADTVPGGGEVRIQTTDPVALAAVHQFLAFQRQDHRVSQESHEPGTVTEHH